MSSDKIDDVRASKPKDKWRTSYFSYFSTTDESPSSALPPLCNETSSLNNVNLNSDNPDYQLASADNVDTGLATSQHNDSNDIFLCPPAVEDKKCEINPADDLDSISDEENFDDDFDDKSITTKVDENTDSCALPKHKEDTLNNWHLYSSDIARTSQHDFVSTATIRDAMIVDPRINRLCSRYSQPSPYDVLREHLTGFHTCSESIINMKFTKNSRSKPFKQCIMTLGKHTVSVIYKTKEEGKQKASQEMLYLLNPKLRRWGTFLGLYKTRNTSIPK